MLKKNRSWSKEKGREGLIATKKVDWSIFLNGSHIPIDFHEDFKLANNGVHLNRGEKHTLTLLIDGNDYRAQLVNVDRNGINADSLLLRYDNNKDLKELLRNKFNTSYTFLMEKRSEEKNQGKVVHVPDEMAEYMNFYQTEEPFVYRVELVQSKSGQRNNRFWWVNQGQSAKIQTKGGFLWSPKTDKKGTPLAHHNDVMLAQPGDIVFAYSDVAIRSICIVDKASEDKPKPTSFSGHSNWEEQGNYLKVTFHSLDKVIQKTEIPEQWRKEEDGPFDRNGNVKQGYFYKVSNSFSARLLERFHDRLPQEIAEHVQLLEGNDEDDQRREGMKFSSDQEFIDHVQQYINVKGFMYSKDQLMNFYLALKTKPFVILSGISGTGKTKIVQLFAEALEATEENGQFSLIPVRPDWSDGSDLIGFENIKGEFQPGPFTKVLIEANKPDNHLKPYFALLDEMNLARVEYYFSDLLSVMESRKVVDGEFLSTPIVDREEVGTLYLRDNVYIIGTVNMDETTHPFSPKVLDRANTIEYNDVVLDHFGFLTNESAIDPLPVSNQQVAGRFLNLKDAFFDYENLVKEITSLLVEVNMILEPMKAHFGYRVRDEICFYMIYNSEGQLMSFDDAFDYQLLQKVLPRLTGNDLKTEEALKKLFRFCTSHEWDELNAKSIIREGRYKKSAKKVSSMISTIVHDGFTSFWGS
jgi:5-methylcytosine-specific restriction enzyme B